MRPIVSIIVPVYNIAEYLHRCISSILEQTFTNFELIIVDDGSTDQSGMICEEFSMRDERVKVIHKNNGGLCSARNAGLMHAEGEWICVIDGDDWVAVDYIEKLYNKALECGAEIVTCDFYFAYRDRNERYTGYAWKKQGVKGLAEYIATVWTTLWGNIHKRSLYAIGNFRSPENICYCEDFHLMCRLISVADSVAKVEEPLYFYRQQDRSIMHNLNKKTMYDEIWAYLDTIKYFCSKGIFNQLKRAMAWRTLKATQELVLDAATFDEFVGINPEKKEYIWTCPYLNYKLKIMMWCLTHNLSVITYAIAWMRQKMGR